MKLRYKAEKIEKVLLAPLFDRDHAGWESHHVTNPTVFRLKGDSRTFLGYRAGGDRDHYVIDDLDVFSSSLGLALLDESGARVLRRLILPIMTLRRPFALPQSPDDYAAFSEAHGEDVCVLHDFRLYELDGYLHVIYHDGTVTQAYDVVRRMPVSDFLSRLERSLAINDRPVSEIRGEWAKLWWGDDVWEPCGVEGRLLFPTVEGRSPSKTDVVYYELGDGVQMMRRPLPDISVLSVGRDLRGRGTPDGDEEMGVLEQCIRPGMFDNSHIGPNGAPTRAEIGGRPVYIDICHGVHNEALTRETPFSFAMTYSPYFRMKDAVSGDLLYYGEQPVVDPDDPVWQEYTRNGRWIQALSHRYILFAGGQVEMAPGQIGEDDRFTFYSGAGDTAVVRAEFTIRGLTPPEVLEDIRAEAAHLALPLSLGAASVSVPGDPSGWEWRVQNDAEKRRLTVVRRLAADGGEVSASRPICKRPGYFDADCLSLDERSLVLTDVGYCLLYAGLRWFVEDGRERTQTGFGLLVLDRDNPERILYRSSLPIEGYASVQDGFATSLPDFPEELRSRLRELVPSQVSFEILRAEGLVREGVHWVSHHTEWLRRRAKRAGRPALWEERG